MLRILSAAPISHLIVIIVVVCSQRGYTANQGASTEDILCRMCGEEISNIKHAHNRLSPDSISIKNQTDFDRSDIYFQILENPSGIRFKLMTLFKSSCWEHGSWYAEHTWFPGFAWRVCSCPRCKTHLGWRFKPIYKAENTLDKASTEGFYGLNVEALVSHKVATSLIQKIEL